jgi:2-polyprenyl-6-methoxyphenol hydroxylase-like FAD-dependent oxidoreductase
MNRTIVVGAGPAGLTLALQLARAGQAVTLVEANPDLSRQSRGDALMPSGLEALARMGLWPVLERLPQRPLEGWSVWLERRRLFAACRSRWAPCNPAAWCRRGPLLEALLREARRHPGPALAAEQAGARAARAEARGRVHRRPQLADGQRLEADLVVACDGRASTLRGLAGLELRGSGRGLEAAVVHVAGGGRRRACSSRIRRCPAS